MDSKDELAHPGGLAFVVRPKAASGSEGPAVDAREFRHIRRVFEAVWRLPDARRAERLKLLCRDDPDVRREVEELLRYVDRSSPLPELPLTPEELREIFRG